MFQQSIQTLRLKNFRDKDIIILYKIIKTTIVKQSHCFHVGGKKCKIHKELYTFTYAETFSIKGGLKI